MIAETRWGDPDNVIVVGAHLDSVGTGNGINDNGSGSAGILEIAEQLRLVHPQNKVRFVWFSAEESGLLGSEHYVATLPAEERAKIAAMLNFDMIGSPNFVRFVYDGDTSDYAAAGRSARRRLGRDRAAVPRLLRRPGPGDGADRLRRPLGLRAVHRGGHPGRWSLHRRRGDQDARAGGDLRRSRRSAVRPLLPPGLRPLHEPERHRARADGGRGRARHDHARAERRAARIRRGGQLRVRRSGPAEHGRSPRRAERRAAGGDRGWSALAASAGPALGYGRRMRSLRLLGRARPHRPPRL